MLNLLGGETARAEVLGQENLLPHLEPKVAIVADTYQWAEGMAYLSGRCSQKPGLAGPEDHSKYLFSFISKYLNVMEVFKEYN